MTQKQTSRPYPKDIERKLLITNQLYKHGITQAELATALGMQKSHLSEMIWGKRRSPAIETKIAMFFGLEREALFPARTHADIKRMREQEEAA